MKLAFVDVLYRHPLPVESHVWRDKMHWGVCFGSCSKAARTCLILSRSCGNLHDVAVRFLLCSPQGSCLLTVRVGFLVTKHNLNMRMEDSLFLDESTLKATEVWLKIGQFGSFPYCFLFSTCRQKTIIFSVIYLILIFGIQHFMKERRPFNLRAPLVLWSFSLTLFR